MPGDAKRRVFKMAQDFERRNFQFQRASESLRGAGREFLARAYLALPTGYITGN